MTITSNLKAKGLKVVGGTTLIILPSKETEDKKYKPCRWVTVLLTAEAHRKLTIMALDTKVSLTELGKAVFSSFLEGSKERQSRVVLKAKERR